MLDGRESEVIWLTYTRIFFCLSTCAAAAMFKAVTRFIYGIPLLQRYQTVVASKNAHIRF
jgi:hypothetical protein